MRIVDIKDGDGCTAYLRGPHKHGSVPLEVTLPPLTAGIEEPNDVTGLWVSAAQVRALVQVAPMTAPTSIGISIRPAVLLGDNVLDMEKSRGGGTIGEVTVFAPPTGPLAHELAKRAIHRASAVRLSRARAFAWRMAMKSMA